MMDVLSQIEQSTIATWIRESPSVWAYPTILFSHTVGMSLVAGISTAIDLRILGVAPEISVKAMQRFLPVFWIGFAINALSGTTLLAIDATNKLSNPVFYVKMVFIAVALALVHFTTKNVLRNPLAEKMPISGSAKAMAAVSLVCWAG